MSGRQIEGGRYVLAVLVAAGILLPTGARAQPCQHGASIFKTCESVKRTCANPADCDDGIQCTDDACDTTIGNTTNCLISLARERAATTKINEAFDIDDFGATTRTPPVGNRPSAASSERRLLRRPTLPCFVGPGARSSSCRP
jgi:hypothetical protein